MLPHDRLKRGGTLVDAPLTSALSRLEFGI